LLGVRGTPDLSSAYAFGRSFSCETLRSWAYQEANQLCRSRYLQSPMTTFEPSACSTTCPTVARAANVAGFGRAVTDLPTIAALNTISAQLTADGPASARDLDRAGKARCCVMSGAAAAVAAPMPMAVATAAGEAVGRCCHQKGQGQQAQRDATHRGLLSRDRSHDDRSGLPWPYQWSGACPK
jgi:hypothetical protein